jgi:hypothetical protein
VGDTFTMSMYLPEFADYVMLNRITAFERGRADRLGADAR